MTQILIDLGVPGIVGGLLGVLLGWQLTQKSAANARLEERAHADLQAVRQREREVAVELETVLAELEHALTTFRRDDELVALRPSEVATVGVVFRRAWARLKYRLSEHSVRVRMESLDEYLGATERWAKVDDAPSQDLFLQIDLGVAMGRSAIGTFVNGRTEYPPLYLPTRQEWSWVYDHGPSDDVWTCVSAWIELHQHDDPLLFLAYGVRQGLMKEGTLPGYRPDWQWVGHWAKPDPSTWRYPPPRHG